MLAYAESHMADNFSGVNVADIYKKVYTGPAKEDLIYKSGGLWKDIPKDTKLLGEDGITFPVRYNAASVASNTVTVAKTLSTAGTSKPGLKKFTILPVQDHAWTTISHLTLLSCKDSKAFWNAHKMAMEDCVTVLSNRMAHSIFRSGYGSIGRVKANDGSATVTLYSDSDMIAFNEGDQCVFAQTEASAVLRDSGDILIVKSVDRDAGKVEFTTAISNVSGLQNDDYIFHAGDRQHSVTPERWKVSGLEAWGPSAKVGGSDSFFGCNRSTDSNLQFTLCSGRLDAPEDAIRNAVLKMKKRGFSVDKVYAHWNVVNRIFAEQTGQRIIQPGGDVKLGFSKVYVMTGAGPIEVVGDSNCQENAVWGLKLDSLKLYSVGETISLVEDDGLKGLRQVDANGQEIRFYSYAQLGCDRPGTNFRLDLTA